MTTSDRNTNHFADVILPLAVKGKFTYIIPDAISERVKPGCRVIVQFGNRKLYSGIVEAVHSEKVNYGSLKEIVDVIDEQPLISEKQLILWDWISSYYMCTKGEVMKAALPSGLSLEEESTGEFHESFKPHEETFLKLSEKFTEATLNELLDKLKKAPRQYSVLAAYIEITGYSDGTNPVPIRKSVLLKNTNVTLIATNSLVQKGILIAERVEVDRIERNQSDVVPVKDLSNKQAKTLSSVREQFLDKEVVLIHGVTSSGKTEIYIHLIEEQLKKGMQVLYMLPEIALTTQIIERLKNHFGPVTGVYHSRFSDSEKVEIWRKVKEEDPSKGYRLILGVRSSVFLPFKNLGLVVIDEEHDGSYKQQDPAPRYNARDTAIVLAGLHKAKTIMGSATPSVESYYNAEIGKYGLANLLERYGNINLPEIILADTRESKRKKLMVSHFTPELLNIMDAALGKGEQIALFQNRRGFAPFVECDDCGWVPGCSQCAVKLTYHKGIKRLICHYCGHSVPLPHSCGNCGSTNIVTRGFGTEKIEDEIKIVFPEARVLRMDQDTTRKKNSYNKIISGFEHRQIDILIGTQMISKGLDFENLTVVGVLNADSMLNYPDFRAYERSYQLIEQVSGRAGRRTKQGKVVIQTSDPANNIIRLILSHNYIGLYRMQMEERNIFMYPPFCRLIRLNIRHKETGKLNIISDHLATTLKKFFGTRVLGPETPLIGRIQLWHIKTILLKIEKDKSVNRAKHLIMESIGLAHTLKGFSSVRISVDVDPL